MDQHARAAFVISQAACMQAQLVAMQATNAADTLAGRPLSYQPHDFESLPDQFALGHNTVVSFLNY